MVNSYAFSDPGGFSGFLAGTLREQCRWFSDNSRITIAQKYKITLKLDQCTGHWSRSWYQCNEIIFAFVLPPFNRLQRVIFMCQTWARCLRLMCHRTCQIYLASQTTCHTVLTWDRVSLHRDPHTTSQNCRLSLWRPTRMVHRPCIKYLIKGLCTRQHIYVEFIAIVL